MLTDSALSFAQSSPVLRFIPPRALRAPLLLLLGGALLGSTLAACGGHAASAPAGQAPVPVAARATRALAGDTVYIVEYTVTPARRDQFERFFTEAYFPALRQVAKTDTSAARVLRQSRLLAPARPSEDGTLSYLLVLDPVVHGERYDLAALLRRVYPAAESDRRYRQLTESWARPFVVRPYVQPPYPDAAP